MKFQISVLAAACVFHLSATAQQKGSITYEKSYLYAPSVRFGEFTYGEPTDSLITIYGEKGKRIYTETGNYIEFCFYDSKGNLAKEFTVEFGGEYAPDRWKEYIHNYKCDTKGRVIEDDIYLVQDNSNNNYMEDTTYFGKAKTQYKDGKKTTIHYDAYGRTKQEKDEGYKKLGAFMYGLSASTTNIKRDEHGNPRIIR